MHLKNDIPTTAFCKVQCPKRRMNQGTTQFPSTKRPQSPVGDAIEILRNAAHGSKEELLLSLSSVRMDSSDTD